MCIRYKAQRVDKPSHSLSGLQRFSITLKRRQRAKIKIILALCQQSEAYKTLVVQDSQFQVSVATS
ncbi:hypothetical protein AAVD42_15435 [Bacillus pumilus]